MEKDTLCLLRTLTAAFGPTGNEEKIRSTLQGLFTQKKNQIHTDALGNLIVHRPGIGENKRSLLFSAHMDSIGFMVTEIKDNGYLSFIPLGGFLATDLARTRVVLYPKGDNPLYGVIVPSEKKESKHFGLEDLYIDIGAEGKADAQALVQPGDCGSYRPELFVQGNRVFSTYLDNRSGCAALASALLALEEQDPYNDIYLAFTVQEEIGMRGAKTVAFDLPVDYAFAVDVTCTADQADSDEGATALLGKGAALKLRDNSVLCNRPLFARLQALAQGAGIPWQTDILKSGGTDAGSLQFTGGGLPVGGISIPCRYTHSPLECMDLRDYAAVIDLLHLLMESEIAK